MRNRTISYSVVLIDLCKFKNDIKCPEVRKLLWFYEEFKSLEELQEKTFKKYPLLKSYSGNHVKEYVYYINESLSDFVCQYNKGTFCI